MLGRRGSTGDRRGGRQLTAALIAILLAGCTSDVAVPALPAAIPKCDDVPAIAAAPERYGPGKVMADEAAVDTIITWAHGQPAFEEIWIDRDQHDGWITIAFSRDALVRQLDIEREFPGLAVVALEVPWTMPELQDLQGKVMRDLQQIVSSSGIRPNLGVVSVGIGVLEPARIAQVQAKFGGARVCVEGIDPADAPVEGPQLEGGEGWRLIADQDRVGPPYDTGIAADAEGYAALWAEIGLPGEPAAVDFETEVAIWFGAVHGSSCPRLRLDDVVVDVERALVYSAMTRFEIGGCTADAIGHAYVVAVARSKLPHGPFTIQLQSEDPPAGVIDQERTIVDVDLTLPGSTLPRASG